MTGNKVLLKKIRKCETNQFVTVANSEKLKILSYGSINLFSKEISNILLVQNCTSNLLSINKIAHEFNCEVIFSSKNVIFQEWITKNVIGKDFLENELYFLNEEKYNFNTKKGRRMKHSLAQKNWTSIQ
jgi:hypothetical protein